MRFIGPMDVTGLAENFEVEAQELFCWPVIEYRLEVRENGLQVVLCAVRFHGVDVLPQLSEDERAFYLQQCLNHRTAVQAQSLA